MNYRYKVLLRQKNGLLESYAAHDNLRLFYNQGKTTEAIPELWNECGFGLFVFVSLDEAQKYASRGAALSDCKIEIWKVEVTEEKPAPEFVFWGNLSGPLNEIVCKIQNDVQMKLLTSVTKCDNVDTIKMVKTVKLIEKVN